MPRKPVRIAVEDVAGAADRFWAKTATSAAGCMEWTGYLARGYGRFHVGGKMLLAHRVAYTLVRGEIPEGLFLDHLCRNTKCVNPEHLDPVVHIENARRGRAGVAQSERTHCPRGHEYSGENLAINTQGQRQCRECARLRGRARYQDDRKAGVKVGDWTRTECARGHDMTGDGAYAAPDGRRHCRTCIRENRQKFELKARKSRPLGVD